MRGKRVQLEETPSAVSACVSSAPVAVTRVALVVLARCRVGPCGGSVCDGCFAAGDLDAEVADGEVDGSLARGLGRDRRLCARFVRGLVRVGAGDVRRARGCGRCAARQGQGGRDDRGAQHDGGGDGQGCRVSMTCVSSKSLT